MSIRKALAFSFIDRYASLFVGIGSSMVLARLLTPADVGVFSVTVVLLSFATTFRDLGAGQYLVQEKELTQDRIRAVWAVQLGIGALLAVLALLACVPVSLFYKEPRMRDIMLVLAASYLVNPFGSITYAWLMRNLRYDALAVMRFSGSVVGAAVSMLLAWRGGGPISLAFGSLAGIVTTAAVGVCFRPSGYPWMPGLAQVRHVLAFGSRLTTTTILETAVTGAPELLLGKFQDLASVGLFSRANGLIAMFSRLVSDSVNTVALAMFAKGAREDGSFARHFVRANAYMTALGWSFALMVALLAHPLIRVLYGAGWDASVPATRWLALVMMLSVPSALCFQALLAAGAASRLLQAMLRVTLVTIPAAGIGALFGIVPMVIGLLVAALLASAIWLRVAHAELGFAWSEFRRELVKSAAVAAVSSLAPLGVFLWAGPTPAGHHLLLLALGGGGAGLGFIAGALAVDHPIAAELRALGTRIVLRFGARAAAQTRK